MPANSSLSSRVGFGGLVWLSLGQIPYFLFKQFSCFQERFVKNKETKKDRNKQKQQKKTLRISSYNCSLWQRTEVCQADGPQVMNLPGKSMLNDFSANQIAVLQPTQ